MAFAILKSRRWGRASVNEAYTACLSVREVGKCNNPGFHPNPCLKGGCDVRAMVADKCDIDAGARWTCTTEQATRLVNESTAGGGFGEILRGFSSSKKAWNMRYTQSLQGEANQEHENASR